MQIHVAGRRRKPDAVAPIVQQLRRREAGHGADEPVGLRKRRRQSRQQRMLTPAQHQMMQRRDMQRRQRILVLIPPAPVRQVDPLAQAQHAPSERIRPKLGSPGRAARRPHAPRAGHRSAGHSPRRRPPARRATAAAARPAATAVGSVHSRASTASWQTSTRATGNVGRGDGRGARRHDGNRRARQDLAVGQSGRAADRAAAKALDADGEEVARQVALDQHRCRSGTPVRRDRHRETPAPHRPE